MKPIILKCVNIIISLTNIRYHIIIYIMMNLDRLF